MINNKRVIRAFLSILWVGFFLSLLLPDQRFSPFENRMLTQFPKISLKELSNGNLGRDFENYVADQFPLRDRWVALKANLELASGKTENNGIIFGKDGFLFEKYEHPALGLIDENIESIRKLSDLGVKVFLLLVPNSVAVHTDKLPLYAPIYPQLSILDHVRQEMLGRVHFIDVYNTLYKNKDYYIFFKTDHHWTSRGAYFGYSQFIEEVSKQPIPIENFSIITISDSFFGTYYSKARHYRKTGDLLELFVPKSTVEVLVDYKDSNRQTDSLYEFDNLTQKDQYTVFLDGNHALLTITTSLVNEGELLVIKDSYAHVLIPFLVYHYSKIHVIDPRYYNLSIREYIKENALEEVLVLFGVSSLSSYTDITKLKH